MKIGLLGLGTVGQAVLDALAENHEIIAQRSGGPITVKRALILHPERHQDYRHLITTQWHEILADPEIAIVVEVIGGMEPACTYIQQALAGGKSVVTANKEVLATHGADLFLAAEQSGRDLLFEASVGAGVPVIRAVKLGLAGNRVQQVTGILNGTTNFMLTAMAAGGDYQQALVQAQAAGYAEADPSADVEGDDAARKIAILASVAFSSRVVEADVTCTGIGRLEAADLAWGARLGWVLKLLARAREVAGRLEVAVYPAWLPDGHALAHVDGIMNAVAVRAEPLGEAMFMGPGAGGPATASAVLGDLIEAARNLRLGGRGVGCTCYQQLEILDPALAEDAFYLRLTVRRDRAVLSQLAAILAEHHVGLRQGFQQIETGGQAEVVVVTEICRRGDLDRALTHIAQSPAVFTMRLPLVVEAPVGPELPRLDGSRRRGETGI